ncbi:hypothetical protein B7463_g8747, partial [Scytalidium lignicola]
MVLPDSQVDGLDESTPQSDTDPYFQSDSASTPFSIDTTNFPKPIPLIGPLFGFNDKLQAKIINKRLLEMQNVLKRPPTHDEANALAYWSAKQLSLYSYGPPAGISAGCYRAYNTMSTFQFPFFKPNPETFTPTVFPPVMPFLSGRAAVIAWHALRFATYGFVGNFVSQILFGSYSVSVATVGEMGDPRLKNYLEIVRKISRERLSGVAGQPGGPGQQQQQQQQRLPQNQRQTPVDDASPTAGTYGDEGTSYSYGDVPAPDSGDAYQNSSLQSQSESQLPPQPRRQFPTRPSVPSTPYPTATSSSPSDKSQPFDFFDDASPTGGQGSVDTPSFQQQQQTKAMASPSGESTWARIRAGALSSSPGSPPTPPQSSDGSESQREFDAKLERERRGGDFDSSSGQKRW